MPRIGKYDLLDLLGRGGCGEVWKARDTDLGRIVALKLMQRTDAEDLARFKREAHVVAQLSHPNIAQLYEFSMEPAYLAMQLIEGGPISEAKEKIAALRDAAQAVHFAHQRGILHRDLKPANIMVDSSGRASVLDFGLAREVKGDQTAMTMSGDILGTPSFMAPEQARGDVKSLDVRTDVYGLGATLYFLLTGRPPHTGASAYDVIRSVLENDPTPSGGDRDLETICLKALEKDPARRYASAEEFAEDVDRYLSKEPIRARPASTLYRLKKKIQKHPAVWGLSGLLVAAVAIGAGFGLYQVTARLKDFEARERARPHLDAARKCLARLEIMQRSESADPEEEKMATDALEEVAKALAEYPKLPEAYLERGRVHRMMRQNDDAVKAFDRAIELSPQLATARLERALVKLERYENMRHESGGGTKPETEEAKSMLRLIVEDLGAVREWSKDYGDLKYAEGLLKFAQGEFGPAADALGTYVEKNPTDAWGWGWLGHALYHAKRPKEAEAALTESLANRPRLWAFILWRGNARHDQGNYAGSIDDCDRAISIHPNDFEGYNNRGGSRRAMGDLLASSQRLDEARVEWARAIADFDRAIAIQPNDVRGYRNRGLTRQSQGDFPGAFIDFDRVLAINPNFAEGYVMRGYARQLQGDLSGATADFDRAIAIDAGDAKAYYNRGTARADLGDHPGAIADFDRAIAIDSANGKAYANRAAERHAKGDLAGAIADCDRAIAIEPNLAEAYMNRGVARRTRGNQLAGSGRLEEARVEWTEALDDFNRALAIRPNDAMLLYDRGLIHQSQKHPSEAIADYDRAIQINPNLAEAYANRAVVKRDLGRLPEARDDFRRALEVAPKNWSYRSKVDELLRDVEKQLGSDF